MYLLNETNVEVRMHDNQNFACKHHKKYTSHVLIFLYYERFYRHLARESMFELKGSTTNGYSFAIEKCYLQNSHHEHAKLSRPTDLLQKAQSTGGSGSSPPLELCL
jgi:hypothetical protein